MYFESVLWKLMQLLMPSCAYHRLFPEKVKLFLNNKYINECLLVVAKKIAPKKLTISVGLVSRFRLCHVEFMPYQTSYVK